MRKVILDCDPGMDDAMAIIVALKSKEIEVMGITTVTGNYHVDVTSINALKIVEMLGMNEVPVYRGMEKPMVRIRPKDPFTHGQDGLADANLPEPRMKLANGNAVNFIINLVHAYPNEISVIALAPLTNIAMAIALDPTIIPEIKEIIAISGAFGLHESAFLNATGDTPQSEWNVYVDPEASKLVYESGIPFTAIGLDIATNFNADFPSRDIDRFSVSKKPEAGFLFNAIQFVKGRGFKAYCTVIDCMAVAYFLKPEIFSVISAHVGVETKEGLTLGMTVRDGRHHFQWTQLPKIQIGSDVDYEAFLGMITDLVLQ